MNNKVHKYVVECSRKTNPSVLCSALSTDISAFKAAVHEISVVRKSIKIKSEPILFIQSETQ